MSTRKKRAHEKAIRTTISLSPVIFDASHDVVRKFGFAGLSDYIQARIRKDANMDLATHGSVN